VTAQPLYFSLVASSSAGAMSAQMLNVVEVFLEQFAVMGTICSQYGAEYRTPRQDF